MVAGARFFTVAAIILMPAMAWTTELVQFDYMMNCQGCHLAEGEGFPVRGVPSVKGHIGKFQHVEGGREFLIQVPGSAQSDLNDERLTAVINWMMATFATNELPVDFRPYSVSEVSELRKSPLVDVKGTRALLIEKIKKLGL
jgi:hypothetical protein